MNFVETGLDSNVLQYILTSRKIKFIKNEQNFNNATRI